ncbi:MAG: Fic family protein [Victivallales bacterium]|jgi:Fic family protein
MRAFNYSEVPATLLTPEITNLLSAIHEYKGKQDLYIAAKRDSLKTLLEVAIIQSTDASNRIEGIFTSDARLKAIVKDKVVPQNRTEKELAGYRDVLATIHESYDYITISPNIILQLHRDLHSFLPSGSGGNWKNSDNVIAERSSDGQFVRFEPLSAFETPEAINCLCENYKHAIQADLHDPLLLCCMFIFDFLCIHPFNDGNGRMSRLLTLLLLYKAGYIVGKYVSIEMFIEKSKETYYQTLQASSLSWHEAANDYKPFIEYYLGIILKAYREFESRVEYLMVSKTTKSERIRMMFTQKIGRISKRDIMEFCPDISQATVEKTLKQLLDEGFAQKVGSGKNTAYIKR